MLVRGNERRLLKATLSRINRIIYRDQQWPSRSERSRQAPVLFFAVGSDPHAALVEVAERIVFLLAQ